MPTHQHSRRVVVAVVTALLTAGVVAGCSDDSAREPAQGQTPTTHVESNGSSATERAALQLTDLPEGYRECEISGEISSYTEHFKTARPETHQELVTTWDRLKTAGATEGYYAYFGSEEFSCRFPLGQPAPHDDSLHEPDRVRGHPATVFSFVTRFNTEQEAAAAYQSGIFGQTSMGPPAYSLITGDPTGLGPNSVMGYNASGGEPVLQAFWQNKEYTVFFGSESLAPPKPQHAVDAINGRLG